MAKIKVVNTGLDSNLNGVNFNNTPSQTIFSFGRFVMTSNFDGRTPIDYTKELSSFVRPVTLETMNLNEAQSQIIYNTTTKAVLNLDKSDLNTFVRYGSAYEFLRTTIETIILNYPGSLYANSQITKTQSITFSAFTYNPITNTSRFLIPTNVIVNKFGLIHNNGNQAIPDNSELKNLNLSYGKYVIWSIDNPTGNSYSLIGFTGNSSGRNYLTVEVNGKPFNSITGNSANSGSINYHIKPNNFIFEEFRALLSDYQRYILSERNNFEGFKFIMKDPILLDNGNIIYSNSELLWVTSDGYNIDIDTPKYRKFLEIVLTIGNKYDTIKTDLIARFLTPASLKTYDLTEEGKMTKLLRLYGREFDELRQFVDSLVNINKVTYDKVNNVPDQLVKNLAKTFGWNYFSLVNENELVESFLTIDDQERNLNKDLLPAEIDIELWRRILLNTNYFWKTKGTREAIKSMFLLIGIPEPFINITEYVYTVDGKINPNTVSLSQIDFPSNSLPYDIEGYPVAPLETNDFFFQVSGDTDSGQAYMNVFRMAGFNLQQTVDNKKSWMQTGATIRQHYTTNQYYQEDSKLVLNTKEVDIALDTARGIEYDVYQYIQKDFAVNSSGYTLPFNYVNISLGYGGSQNTFTLPAQFNKAEGDLEVRFNGILLNAPKEYSGGTGSTYEELTYADYIVSGNSFTLTNSMYAQNNPNRRDVIQATYVYSGSTTPISGISVQYMVARVHPDLIGTTIPLPSMPRGDVQVTMNGIALTKGTNQFNADYIVDPNNTTGSSQIIVQNTDFISYFGSLPTNERFVQVTYVSVTGSSSIESRSEIHRIDSFNSSKLYFSYAANRFVYRLNYKVNNVNEVKMLIDGIGLEPNTDYVLNVNNPFEIYLPKKLNYGSVISAYYLIGGSDIFNPVVDDIFGLGDISNLSFLEFLELAQRKMINARSRKIISDFKGGWYPTLLKIYVEYLKRSELNPDNPLLSNGYTFQNLYSFLSKYNSFFQRFIDQMLSATIILKKSGLLIRNSLYSRQKFTYKRGVNFNPVVNHLGNSGSLFLVLQEETVITPSVKTIIGTVGINSIQNTGGFDIVLFELVNTYGMECRLGTSGGWDKTPIPPFSTPLGVDNFNYNIPNLSPDTQYQYRAYIEVNGIEYYGEIITITTLPLPVVEPSLLTTQGAAGIGAINNTGGQNIIRWEDVEFHAMQYRLGTSGTWITTTLINTPLAGDSFTTSITGLVEGQLYQYRAYMIVDGTEYYGQTRQITTQSQPTTIPSVTTGIAGSITTNSFSVANSTVDDKGNLPNVSKYGVIWTQNSGVGSGLNYSNKSGVDETNSDIAIGTPFTKNATGLLENSQTWYRAFALNTNGYGYGVVKTQQTEASVAEIQFASIIGGNQVVMGGNNLAGKTFSITFSYHIAAACDLIGVSGQNDAATTIEISTNGGLTWTQIDSVQASVFGTGDDESDYQETFGTHTVNGITDITQIRWRGDYDCSSTQFGATGSMNVQITGGSADIGLVLILIASDSFSAGCFSTPFIS